MFATETTHPGSIPKVVKSKAKNGPCVVKMLMIEMFQTKFYFPPKHEIVIPLKRRKTKNVSGLLSS